MDKLPLSQLPQKRLRMHGRFNYKSKDELLAKAKGLGLALPFADDISPLLEPKDLEGFIVPNRLVVQPMEGYDSTGDGSPSDLTRRRYLRYASGGSGMIWFEAVAVTNDGRSNPNQLLITCRNVGSYHALNREIRKTAGEAGIKPMLVIQLTHSGRYSKPDSRPHPLAAARNMALDKTDPHILSDEELDRIQDNYVEAARLSFEAGFDAIDLKACHGYLLIDLLAAKTRENSIYGGIPATSRFRFMLDTLDRIQKEVPGIRITTRLNISDLYEGGFGVDVNNKPDYSEAMLITGELHKRGVTFMNLSMGSPYYNPHVTRPYDTPLPGQKLPEEHPLEGVVRIIEGTAEFAVKFPGISFVGSAYSWLRQFAPNVGAEVVRKGHAAFIGLGRSSFAYPSLPADLMRTGKAETSKVCITCSGCTRLIRNFRPGGCVIRDKEIYARELKQLIANGK